MTTLPTPCLAIRWDAGGTETVVIQGHGVPDGPGLRVAHADLTTAPTVVDRPEATAIVCGAPVAGDRVDPAAVAARLAASGMDEGWLSGLNGQFLLFHLDKRRRVLSVANDRFAARPLYWARTDEGFLCATIYGVLLRALRARGLGAPRQDTLYEYLAMGRLHEDRTHDSVSRALAPASRLRVGPDNLEHDAYWRPAYRAETTRGVRAAGGDLLERLRAGLSRQMADPSPRRYGLLLSGGHDSRAVAAACPTPPHCVTLGFRDNYEVAQARAAARAIGAEHSFVPFPPDHLWRHLRHAAWLAGGMYAPEHAQFLALRESMVPRADVLFHGHGLDYLFQGMYLPAAYRTLFGRPTFFRRLRPLGADVARAYRLASPFRTPDAILERYLLPDRAAPLEDALASSLARIAERGRALAEDPYDLWDHLYLHAPSRHYTYLNILAMETLAEQRTAAFDTDVFDLYLSLPVEQRLDGAVLRTAIGLANPELARIPTANFGIALGASPARKTAVLIGRKLLRHATGIQRFQAPRAEDRTWPRRDAYLAAHPGFQALARRALGSERLADILSFLDWRQIRADREDLATGRTDHSILPVLLIGLDAFLEQVDAGATLESAPPATVGHGDG